jgi:hypothetical protein
MCVSIVVAGVCGHAVMCVWPAAVTVTQSTSAVPTLRPLASLYHGQLPIFFTLSKQVSVRICMALFPVCLGIAPCQCADLRLLGLNIAHVHGYMLCHHNVSSPLGCPSPIGCTHSTLVFVMILFHPVLSALNHHACAFQASSLRNE